MRYWFPFTEEAVQQVRPYTLDQMWPFYNVSKTGPDIEQVLPSGHGLIGSNSN
jgi:hypothetical protein